MIRLQIEKLNNIFIYVLKIKSNEEGQSNINKKNRKTIYGYGGKFPADNMYWDEYGNPAFIDDLAL